MDLWVGIGLALAVLGVAVSVYYGQRTPQGISHGPKVIAKVSNAIPVYFRPGGDEAGDHHVSVEAVNTGDQPITITGWGVKLPNNRNMFVTRPVSWATPLPHVLRPGAPPARLLVLAEDLRRIAREEGIAFDDMRPYVTLADGTEVLGDKSVPLA